jgi:hypothetical protein
MRYSDQNRAAAVGRRRIGALGMAGREQIEEVATRLACAVLTALGNDPLNQSYPTPTEAAAREVVGSRNPDRQQEIEHAGAAEARSITEDQLAHLRPVFVHLEREHRGADDLQGEALQHRYDLDRAFAPRCEIDDERVGGRGDMPRQNANRARREGRGYGSPLLFPLIALAKEQSAAKNRAKDPDRRRRADIVAGTFDEDMADRIGAAEEKLAAAQKPMDDNLFFEGLARERAKSIAAQDSL